MSAWCWLALVEHEPTGADAAAVVVEHGGTPAGWLAAWRRRAKPLRSALRADASVIDPAGDPAIVSLVLPPPGVRWPFDDHAVQGARRAILTRSVPARAVTTLLADASHFAGSLVAVDPGARLDDPFARLFPARRLHVAAGLVGRVPAPAGPCIERYGSARPWPWDRFEEA